MSRSRGRGRRRAIVLGGAANAVSIARSLAPAGVHVRALGGTSDDPVRFSRHCRAYERVSGEFQQQWLDRLRSLPVAERTDTVVFPCDDEAVELVARNRDELGDLGYRPVELHPELALAMLDKEETYALARSVGVEAPRIVAVRDRADLERARAEIPFPCALKPRHSHLFVRRNLGVAKAYQVTTAAELEQAFARTADAGLEMFLTEIVPGAEDAYVSAFAYLDDRGETLALLTKRKLRQFPPRFGLGTLHETRWNEEVAETALRFARGIGLIGVANVEFKRDARDGRLKLIECNYRLTAVNELLRRGGVDLALLSFNRALGLDGPPPARCPDGLRMWSPVDDVRAYAALRRSGELTLGPWLRSILQPSCFPVFRLDDPAPTLTNGHRAVRALRRELARRAS